MKDSLCSSRLGVDIKITTLSQENIYVKRLNDGCRVREEWASAIMEAKAKRKHTFCTCFLFLASSIACWKCNTLFIKESLSSATFCSEISKSVMWLFCASLAAVSS
jgi:hypothetical protein